MEVRRARTGDFRQHLLDPAPADRWSGWLPIPAALPPRRQPRVHRSVRPNDYPSASEARLGGPHPCQNVGSGRNATSLASRRSAALDGRQPAAPSCGGGPPRQGRNRYGELGSPIAVASPWPHGGPQRRWQSCSLEAVRLGFGRVTTYEAGSFSTLTAMPSSVEIARCDVAGSPLVQNHSSLGAPSGASRPRSRSTRAS